MHKSTRIFLTYSATALIVIAAISFLTYQAWESHPLPDTLEHDLRLVALAVLPLLGLSLVIQVVGDPLVWRVIRMLRWKEQHAGASST